MCYNYSLALYRSQEELEKIFNARFKEPQEFKRKYYVNSFSLPQMPVITNKEPDYFQMYTWGLIPFWVKNRKDADDIRTKTMNARGETLFEKPSFRHAIRKKRCLIPADGFYEWREVFGKNYPYYIYLKDHRIFSFAGIWESWRNPEDEGEVINSYSIITCEPNNLLRKIHNKKKRMPVILPISSQKEWLNESLSDEEIKKYIKPFPDEEMRAHTISKLITNRSEEKNTPKIIKQLNYDELKGFE